MALPPLPATDEKSLKQNRYDPFYKTTPRKFWKDAYVEHHDEVERPPCEHIFIENQGGYVCKKCHIGFEGFGLKLKNGHLHHNENLII